MYYKNLEVVRADKKAMLKTLWDQEMQNLTRIWTGDVTLN
jgi:hypothetical protein